MTVPAVPGINPEPAVVADSRAGNQPAEPTWLEREVDRLTEENQRLKEAVERVEALAARYECAAIASHATGHYERCADWNSVFTSIRAALSAVGVPGEEKP